MTTRINEAMRRVRLRKDTAWDMRKQEIEGSMKDSSKIKTNSLPPKTRLVLAATEGEKNRYKEHRIKEAEIFLANNNNDVDKAAEALLQYRRSLWHCDF